MSVLNKELLTRITDTVYDTCNPANHTDAGIAYVARLTEEYITPRIEARVLQGAVSRSALQETLDRFARDLEMYRHPEPYCGQSHYDRCDAKVEVLEEIVQSLRTLLSTETPR